MIDNIEMQMVTKLISNASPEQMAVIENLIKSRKVDVTTTEGFESPYPLQRSSCKAGENLELPLLEECGSGRM